MSAGIYRIKCTATGRVYIGSSKNVTRRLGDHMRDLKTRKHGNAALQSDYDIWGPDAFVGHVIEVIDPATFKDSRDKREQWHLDTIRNCGVQVYNRKLEIGSYPEMTDETRAKMSATTLGRKLSDEHCAKISAGLLGKKLSDETRAKLSAIALGRNMSAKTRAKISAGLLGKKLSAETRAKISAARKKNDVSACDTDAGRTD